MLRSLLFFSRLLDWVVLSLFSTRVNVYRYAPAASIEINTGVSVSFGIGADDPYGLDFSEWYIDST
jgi:hypothetical protein